MAKIKISKKRVCPRGLVPLIFQKVNLSCQVSYNLHVTEVFLYRSLALTRLKDNFPICKIFLGKQFLIQLQSLSKLDRPLSRDNKITSFCIFTFSSFAFAFVFTTSWLSSLFGCTSCPSSPWVCFPPFPSPPFYSAGTCINPSKNEKNIIFRGHFCGGGGGRAVYKE